jgi:hypothetical protein
MTTNFVNFSKYPWGTQCLEMSKTTGHLWCGFNDTMIARFIKAGDFSNALQNATSVGVWADSIQGHDYWEEIYNNEIF